MTRRALHELLQQSVRDAIEPVRLHPRKSVTDHHSTPPKRSFVGPNRRLTHRSASHGSYLTDALYP